MWGEGWRKGAPRRYGATHLVRSPVVAMGAAVPPAASHWRRQRRCGHDARVEGGGASGGVTQNAHPRCCCCSCGSAAADDGHADGAGEGGGTVIRGAAQRRGSERSSDGGCDGREVAGLGVRAPTLAAEATRTAR